MNSTKRYILKPGRHQFAPGSPATHHNNNLSDEEAEWYLEKYPHIVSLFDTIPPSTDPACRVSDPEQPETIDHISITKSVESLLPIGEIKNLKSVESSSQIGEIKKQVT